MNTLNIKTKFYNFSTARAYWDSLKNIYPSKISFFCSEYDDLENNLYDTYVYIAEKIYRKILEYNTKTEAIFSLLSSNIYIPKRHIGLSKIMKERFFCWEYLDYTSSCLALHYAHIDSNLEKTEYAYPEDMICQFCDCSLWIFFLSENVPLNILPIKPYLVIIPDNIINIKKNEKNILNSSHIICFSEENKKEIVKLDGIEFQKVSIIDDFLQNNKNFLDIIKDSL